MIDSLSSPTLSGAAARAAALRVQREQIGEAWVTRLVRFSLWLAWAGLLLRPLFADVNLLRQGARLMPEIAAVILMGVALRQSLRAPRAGEPLRVRRAAMLMTGVAVAPAIYGLAMGTDLNRWAQLGFFPFFSALLIVLGSRPGLLRTIEPTLFAQLALGTVFAAFVLVFDAPTSRGEWIGEDGNGPARFATRSLFAMPYFLPLMYRLPRWKQGVTLLSFLAFAALAIAGNNRGMTLLAFVLIPVGFVGLSLRRRGQGLRQAVAGMALIAVLGGTALLVTGRASSLLGYFDTRWQETSARLTGGAEGDELTEAGRATIARSTEEFAGDQSRGGELRDFVDQLEPIDYLLGRGLGGLWQSRFWGAPWSMVHFGPAHLVLQGGLPLLVVFVLVMGMALVAGFRQARNSDLAAAAVLYLLTFLEGWAQHGAIQDQIEVYFAWICVGITLSARHFDQAPPVETARKTHWLVRRRARAPRPRPNR